MSEGQEVLLVGLPGENKGKKLKKKNADSKSKDWPYAVYHSLVFFFWLGILGYYLNDDKTKQQELIKK